MRKQFLIRIYAHSFRLCGLCTVIGILNEKPDNLNANLTIFEMENNALKKLSGYESLETIRDEKTNSLIIKEDGKLICVIEERETYVLTQDVLPEEKKPQLVHINSIHPGEFFSHAGKIFLKILVKHHGFNYFEVGTGLSWFESFPNTFDEPRMVTHIKQL